MMVYTVYVVYSFVNDVNHKNYSGLHRGLQRKHA